MSLNDELKEIGLIEDEAERREKLAEVITKVEELIQTKDEFDTKLEELTKDNQRLREANMNLFLKVGVNDKPTEQTQQTEQPKLKFEDLFNAKGEIK